MVSPERKKNWCLENELTFMENEIFLRRNLTKMVMSTETLLDLYWLDLVRSEA